MSRRCFDDDERPAIKYEKRDERLIIFDFGSAVFGELAPAMRIPGDEAVATICGTMVSESFLKNCELIVFYRHGIFWINLENRLFETALKRKDTASIRSAREEKRGCNDAVNLSSSCEMSVPLRR